MRIAEEQVSLFNEEEMGTKLLHDSILNQICHINHYDTNEIKDGILRYDVVIGDSLNCYIDVGMNRMPERLVDGDYISFGTSLIAGNIDWLQIYDDHDFIVKRAFEIIQNNYKKKIEDIVLHTMLACGADRNMLVFDSAHSVFSSRTVELLVDVGKYNQTEVTHILISPEAHCHVDNVHEIDGIRLIVVDDFGTDQAYQKYLGKQLKQEVEKPCTEFVLAVGFNQDGAMLAQPITETIKLDHTRFTDKAGFGRLGVSYGGLDNACKIGFICEPNKVLLGCF